MAITRRDFVGNSAAVAGLSLVGRRSLAAVAREQPDLILKNGHVLTMDAKQPQAEAIAVAGERILAVGANDEVGALGSSMTRVVDLGGQTVVPGFIDGHSHPAYSGRRHLRFIDCDLRSIKAIQDAVRARAAKTPPGEWVVGFKYDDTKTAERRFITREDLDAAAPGHPVYIAHRGGHTGYVNSLALAKAGITEQSPDPEGGKLVRDPATGRLTGRLLERAAETYENFDPRLRHDDARRGPCRHQADHADVREGGRHLFHRRLRHAGGPAGLPGRARSWRALDAHLLHGGLRASRQAARIRCPHRFRRRLDPRRRHEGDLRWLGL